MGLLVLAHIDAALLQFFQCYLIFLIKYINRYNTLPLHASICLYGNIDFKNDKHLTSENFKPQINIKNW